MGRKPTYEELTKLVKDLEAENRLGKRALEECRLEAERFRELAELLPEIVFEVDDRGILTFVNQKAFEIAGYSREDLDKGFEALNLLTPQSRGKAEQNVRRVFDGEEVGMSEYTARRKDGSTFPALVRSAPVIRNGKVVGLRGILLDTTEQKRAEKVLRESEKKYRRLFLTESKALRASEVRYRSLVEQMPAVTYIARIDDVRTTEYVSPQIEDVLGFTQEDYRQDPDTWRKALHPDDRDRVLVEVAQAQAKGDPLTTEYRMITRDGRTVWFRDHARIVRDNRNKPLFLQGVMLDITTHKQVREALRESEERFRTVFDGSLDAIILADPDTGEILDVNPTASELVSMPNEEIVGLPYSMFVVPEWRDYAEKMFGRVARDEALGLPREIPVKNADGDSILFEALGQLIQIDGRPVILVVLRDVTERKRVENALRESEARYRRLFDESPIALWEVDASYPKRYMDNLRKRGIEDVRKYFEARPEAALECAAEVRVTDANKASMALFEAGGKESFQTSTQEALIDEEEALRVASIEFANLAEGRTGSEVEDVIVKTFRGNRKRVFYRWIVAPGYEATFEKVLISVMDITERKRMELELQKIQKLESLGILAGGIAHDFNNILTAISTNLSMARLYGELREDISQMLSDAEKASLRAQGLTQQLLAFAKGGTLIKKTVSIPGLIRDTAEFALSGSNARCEYALADDLWLVEADEGQIGQVLQNLVINADQAMPRGGTIRIVADNVVVSGKEFLPLKAGLYTRISVADQGIGISKKDMSNIFDPFFTTKQRGSGLGLTTAFSIVNNHGGHIEVDSVVEEGTTFNIYLPALGRTSAEKEPPGQMLTSGDGRILLVDDEEIIWKATGEALTRMGYEVRFAEDGAVGIELYQEAMNANRPFHAVIMDLTIPGGMGGKETIGKILRMDPWAKIIASSGYSNDPVMSNYQEHGFCGVITKPYRIQELGDLLSRITNGL